MPTFQDARDGLDALLKDGKRNLTPDDKDKAIQNAARTFSRRFPRKVGTEVTGTDGFQYSLPSTFIDGFSTITQIRFPWDVTVQNNPKLERKDFELFDGPTGLVLRFIGIRPATTQQFLLIHTTPHSAATTGLADVVGELDAAGTVISGANVVSTNIIDVEEARDVQLFVHVTAAVGTFLNVVLQTSSDGVRWSTIGAFQDITGLGSFVEPLKDERVSKFIRLVYTTTGGSFTIEAQLLQESESIAFTIPDHSFDAFNYLSTSIACQQLADFYSNLVDSQLEGDTTDYEGKASFWQTNHDKWDLKWKEEVNKIQKQRGALAFGQGEWDLVGTTKFSMLTHDERHR